MKFHQRIRTIYGKELIDILRDHRTLIAMIVVPIVLYPLLMLGSVQAVSFQAARIEEEAIVIGVINDAQGQNLMSIIKADRTALRDQSLEDAESNARETPRPIEEGQLVIKPLGSVEDIDRHVRERRIHLGVVFDGDELVNSPTVRNKIAFRYDKEDVRSAAGQIRLEEVISRVARRTIEERKVAAKLPETFDQPFVFEAVDLSSPPSILGQILPLILVLMTITGAIYPAIDLTAGERERGTLESLMVTPAPVVDLIVGKFLVVTTVALMGAALNLGSVTATVYFGGFSKVIASSSGSMPLGTMLFILLALIPFAVLMSAIMIAVCSFARTFKEAQNYVTPVILAVLIPGGIAALPATKLEGVMLVMPVGNMVLLARDLLLGAHVPVWTIIMVLLSTTLYAGAAVALAAGVFGRESVVFSDAASLGSVFRRRLIKPSSCPGISMALLVASLLFPCWFFVQGFLSPAPGEDARSLLYATAWLMPLVFVLVPLFVLAYWKVNVAESFFLRIPSGRFLVAGLLVGLSAWAPAHELNVLQQRLLGTPEAVLQSAQQIAETIQAMPPALVLLIMAATPALCEELFFRGFLLSGIAPALGRWGGISLSAVIFGVFHFFAFRFTVTAGLGIVLAWLCWQSRSILPGMMAHVLHNAIGVLMVLYPERVDFLYASSDMQWQHLPVPAMAVALTIFVLGIWLTTGKRAQKNPLGLQPAAPALAVEPTSLN